MSQGPVSGAKLWRCEVRGSPVGWAAPKRSLVRTPAGGLLVKARPAESWSDWKRTIQGQAAICAPARLINVPIALEVRVFLSRPRSAPKRWTMPAKRPDLTNLVKGVEDALTGIVWIDDALVVMVQAVKEYGDPPGVVIEVREVEIIGAPAPGKVLASPATVAYDVADE